MIVYQEEAKSVFIVMTKQQKTFSSNWKPFGFRSADAHTRTRVRAGGGVEPAARSSHKPPDAQKEAAKKATNCAKRREERRNLCEQGKNRETRPAGPPRGRSRAPFVPVFLLLLLCRMEQPRTRCRSGRQKRRSRGGNKQRWKMRTRKEPIFFLLDDFWFIFRG